MMNALTNNPYWQLPLKTKLRLFLEMGGNSFANIATLIAPLIIYRINLYYLSEDDSKFAYSICTMYEWAIIYGMIISMNQGANILMSQAFGAKNYLACGIYFQRSLVLLAITLAPLFVFMFYIGELHAKIYDYPVDHINHMDHWDREGQESHENQENLTIASYASIAWLAYIGCACFDSMKSFITSQRVFYPIIIIQVASIPLHVLLAYVFIGQLHLGLRGAAICLVIVEWSCAAMIWLYIKISGKFSETWIRWSRKALDGSDLWKQFKFSLPMVAFLYCTRLFCELVFPSFIGFYYYIPQTSKINVQVSFGVSMTMSTYIANAIGKRTTEVIMYYETGIFVTLAFFAAVFLLVFRFPDIWLTFLFYGFKERDFIFDWLIADRDKFLSPLIIYCFFGQWSESFIQACFGLFKAIGKQEIAYYIYLIVLYPIFGLLFLLFSTLLSDDTKGLVTAYGIAHAIGWILCFYFYSQVRWGKILSEGKERLNDLHIERQELPIQENGHEEAHGLREDSL